MQRKVGILLWMFVLMGTIEVRAQFFPPPFTDLGGVITSDGSVSYYPSGDSDVVGLTNDTVLTSTAGGILNLGASYISGGNYNLTISNYDTVNFGGYVQASFNNLIFTNVGKINVVANDGYLDTTGNQYYGGNMSTGGLILAGGGNITFANTLDASFFALINAAGTVAFNGAVGSVSPPTALDVQSGAVSFGGGLVTATGPQYYGEPVSLQRDTVLNGTAICIGVTEGSTGNTNQTVNGNNHALVINSSVASAGNPAGSPSPIRTALGNLTGVSMVVYGGSITLNTNGGVVTESMIVSNTAAFQSAGGTFNGSMTVQSGGALTVASGGNSINGALTLSGTINMPLGNPVLTGMSSVAYGGQLNVTGSVASPYAGETFQLFQAGGYTGTFTDVQLPAVNGYTWDTSGLATSGTIKLKSTIPAPHFTGMAKTNASVTVSGHGLTNQLYYIQMTTNLSGGMWQILGTTMSDGSGGISFTDTSATNSPRFYLISQ